MADVTDRSAELMDRIAGTDDFYAILDVPRDADDVAIKKAYRRAALALHPDKCQLEGAKEAFQKVSSAFACLSDGERRAYYDRTGREACNNVGHAAHHDPEDIFRAFFGEDFDFEQTFAAGRRGNAGVHFRAFGGPGMQGQTFVFNMGGSPGQGGDAAGAGVVFRLLRLIPTPLLVLASVSVVMWGFVWLLRHMAYFVPILYLAPPRLKLPLCFMVLVLLVTGHLGGGGGLPSNGQL